MNGYDITKLPQDLGDPCARRSVNTGQLSMGLVEAPAQPENRNEDGEFPSGAPSCCARQGRELSRDTTT